MYDILANKHKIEPIARIGTLSSHDSAVCTAITLAVERFQEESAIELAEAAFDGLGLTLLTVYREGIPGGPQMLNPYLNEVCQIIARAGERERSEEEAGRSARHEPTRDEVVPDPAGVAAEGRGEADSGHDGP